jgi:hypothetical protein
VFVITGLELVRGWSPGDDYARVFCSVCGSPLWSERSSDHEILVVRLGSIDGDPGIRPTSRQFVADAAPFEPVPEDGLAHYPQRRPRQD